MNEVLRAAVERLVPHRGGMLWLDRILACDDEGAVAEAVVREEHPFIDGDAVPAWVGIEYMAQCIAAWAGGQALARGEPVKPGFLLGTRRYDCRRPRLVLGSRLRIEARRELMGDNGLGMFACRILDGDEEIAVANVSVFESPDPDAYLGTTPP
ncbi:MAG TPA: hotdog family protein [Arenimonas sp.]|nr:hotdog family protein [Arenimonas sp.]